MREVSGLLSLQRKPEKACGGANRLIDQRIRDVESQIASLGSLKRLLENLRDECDESRPSKDCGILRGLADPVGKAAIRSPSGIGLNNPARQSPQRIRQQVVSTFTALRWFSVLLWR